MIRRPTVQESIALLSALVHADEMVAYLGPSNSSQMNAFNADRDAFISALDQVRSLLAEYDAMALVPVRRDGVKYAMKATAPEEGK